MKYFILRVDNSQHPFPIKNWGPFESFLNYNCDNFNLPNTMPNPEASNWQMLSKVKLTDVVAGFNHTKGFVVSDRFKKLLLNFKLPLHSFIPVTINHKQKRFDNYSFLLLPNLPQQPEVINYSKSTFFPTDSATISQVVQVKDFQDSLTKNAYLLEDSTIYLTKFGSVFDILMFIGVPYHCLISEPLKIAIEKEKISGLKIIEGNFYSDDDE